MNKLSTSRTSRHAGFTLIEMIVAVLLIGILGAIGSEVVLSGLLSTKRVNENNAGSAAARYGVERLSREIREISNDNGAYQITSARKGGISFKSNINQPTFDVPTEIAFQAAGGGGAGSVALARNPAPDQLAPVLISDVTSFGLRYYTGSGAELVFVGEAIPQISIPQIRAIRIDMTVKSEDSPPIAVSSYIALRN